MCLPLDTHFDGSFHSRFGSQRIVRVSLRLPTGIQHFVIPEYICLLFELGELAVERGLIHWTDELLVGSTMQKVSTLEGFLRRRFQSTSISVHFSSICLLDSHDVTVVVENALALNGTKFELDPLRMTRLLS